MSVYELTDGGGDGPSVQSVVIPAIHPGFICWQFEWVKRSCRGLSSMCLIWFHDNSTQSCWLDVMSIKLSTC